MTPDEIVNALRENAEWCDANEYDVPLCMGDNQRAAADLLESQQARITELESQLADARNELCQKCGRYHEAHKGACNGCRWKEMPNA